MDKIKNLDSKTVLFIKFALATASRNNERLLKELLEMKRNNISPKEVHSILELTCSLENIPLNEALPKAGHQSEAESCCS